MTHELSAAVLGGADLDDAIFSIAEGGRVLTAGLTEVLHERHPDLTGVEFRRLDTRDIWALAADLDAFRREIQGVEVVLRSIQPDVDGPFTGRELAQRFTAAMAEVIAACKGEGCRLILLNGCTFDPDDAVSCYQDVGETMPLTIHRLDLELIELSMLDGISVVDADRMVAELGGRTHVEGQFRYSPELCAAIRDELAVVLEEYGFLDDRPLLVQQGRRER